MNISIICPSEIAYRRFMPAISHSDCFSFAGVGYHSSDEIEGVTCKENLDRIVSYSREKAKNFIANYGGHLYNGYNEVIADRNVEATYIPLPPKFHYKYAMKSLLNKKHVLIEKPATLTYEEMNKLVCYAKEHNLAIHENYMFVFHKQLLAIRNYIDSGVIGDIRLYRIAFGFPFRGKNDFRYSKSSGGGALNDAGGYTIKLASYLLGKSATVISAVLNFTNDFDVDLYGHGMMKNDDDKVAQISFGMDNEYKCELEVWGSKGTLQTNRIFTAPVAYVPVVNIIRNGVKEEIALESDDAFCNSISYFKKCIEDKNIREKNYDEMLFQAELFESFKNRAGVVW